MAIKTHDYTKYTKYKYETIKYRCPNCKETCVVERDSKDEVKCRCGRKMRQVFATEEMRK